MIIYVNSNDRTTNTKLRSAIHTLSPTPLDFPNKLICHAVPNVLQKYDY